MTFRKKLFAWILKNGDAFNHKIYRSYKKELFRHARGAVVEIGPGSGVNFSYFPKAIQWIGIEPNEAFHDELRKKATEHGIKADLVTGDASHIPLPDQHADVVVCTLVLCSVADPVPAIAEMKRVLKPGGKFLFIEHVAAPAHSRLRMIQNLSNPFNRFMADGCNCNRETWNPMERAGFSSLELTHFRPKGSMPLHTPHIMGIAVK